MRFICGCLLIAVPCLGATSPAWKPSWPLPHRHHDQQQQQHCREKMRLMQGKPRVH
ncbi:hypothetical protein PR002_g31036 [Phytophthora rubi]|uniref:RxLR effector protein n=1 Tax=Phytophthora rubi TaxID=129364 RepID=A0A6A3GGI1_9STRA|nr:hypothetical protein PR002_g31036 [Phytophthora rubi]